MSESQMAGFENSWPPNRPNAARFRNLSMKIEAFLTFALKNARSTTMNSDTMRLTRREGIPFLALSRF